MRNGPQILSARIKAMGLLEEAINILKNKAGAEDGLYTNSRCVKMAARRAYQATLMILDEYLKDKQAENFNKPTNLDDYNLQLQQCDKKLMLLCVTVRDRIYLLGCIYGSKSMNNMRIGLKYINRMLCFIYSPSQKLVNP